MGIQEWGEVASWRGGLAGSRRPGRWGKAALDQLRSPPPPGPRAVTSALRNKRSSSSETPECQLRAEAGGGGTCSLPFPRGT